MEEGYFSRAVSLLQYTLEEEHGWDRETAFIAVRKAEENYRKDVARGEPVDVLVERWSRKIVAAYVKKD